MTTHSRFRLLAATSLVLWTTLIAVPASAAVLGSQAIQDRNIVPLVDLGDGSVPGLKVAPFYSRNSALIVNIRGVGRLSDGNLQHARRGGEAVVPSDGDEAPELRQRHSVLPTNSVEVSCIDGSTDPASVISIDDCDSMETPMSLVPHDPADRLGMSFRGPVAGAILDWAGTVLDFGCMAPVLAFRDAFEQAGVGISEGEAMGAAKREHVALILAQPPVQARWRAAKGAASTEADVDTLYAAFLRSDERSCAAHSALIPGALDAIAALRARGVAVGSTTGYPQAVMDMLLPLAAEQGYRPDFCATVDDVPRGRPYPDMLFANMLALGCRMLPPRWTGSSPVVARPR